MESFIVNLDGDNLDTDDTSEERKCHVCLRPRGSYSQLTVLSQDTIRNVLHSLLLIPSSEEPHISDSISTNLLFCSDCSNSWTYLNQLFLRLETLRCEFNELRLKIGRNLIGNDSWKSKKVTTPVLLSTWGSNYEAWEASIKTVEHVFPSCLQNSDDFTRRKNESIEIKMEVEEDDLFDDIPSPDVDPEIPGEFSSVIIHDLRKQDVKLNMTPIVSLERLRPIRRHLCRKKLKKSSSSDCSSTNDDIGIGIPKMETSTSQVIAKKSRAICTICKGTFAREDILRLHMKRFHGINKTNNRKNDTGIPGDDKSHQSQTPAGFPCSHCDTTFSDKLALKKHSIQDHFLGRISSGDKQCQFCLKFFPGEMFLKAHQRNFHSYNPSNQNSSGDLKTAKKIGCFICNYTTTSDSVPVTPEWLKYVHEISGQHRRSIDSSRTIHCNVCRINFKGNLEDLKTHLASSQSHQDEVDKLERVSKKKKNYDNFCIPCRLGFETGDEFKTHLGSVNHKTWVKFRNQPYESKNNSNIAYKDDDNQNDTGDRLSPSSSARKSCEFCGEKFSRRKDLLTHRRMTHVDLISRRFHCEICGKSYTQNRNLKRHILVNHLGEECKCSQCGNAYPTALALEVHWKQTHFAGRGKDSGFPSFDCQFCPEKYKKHYLLRKHLCLNHPKEHLEGQDLIHCFVCWHTFPAGDESSGEMEIHMKSHEHLLCKVCNKYFPTKYALAGHESSGHKTKNDK